MIYPKWKRFMDIIGALLGIFIMLPISVLVAIAIKLDTCGPVFVELDRISNGRLIRVYKFRSMINGAHKMKQNLMSLNERSDGPFFKIKNDPRLTRVGRIIRKFRIDETPQLLNVLKRELALVGPRPHEPEEISHYPEEYKKIPYVMAGVTGLSQVNGASSLPYLKELEYDKYYIENMAFVLDLKILFRSIAILFFDPTAV
jgi:lipopolysaccharide/colanic/teichoic acid biosynthesis glycosyltransferase